MKKSIVFWVERYFYTPTVFDRFLSFLLFPFSLIYCSVVYVKYLLAKPEDMGIKVVGIGNLTVGGSGKTPLITALAAHYNDVAIVLRGYGRKTTGTLVVAHQGELFCNVEQSGDEAMLYAKKLQNVTVIVSEERKAGIKQAKDLGAKMVFLDDAYSKHAIKKLDFVLHVNSKNHFCLPSGPFREKLWRGKKVYVLHENKDFKRKVTVKDPTPNMVLVTAIARPQRLDPFLPHVKQKYYFEDHYDFTRADIEKIIEKEKPTSLLVTLKDYVKLEQFGFPLSLLDLDIEIDPRVFTIINDYLNS